MQGPGRVRWFRRVLLGLGFCWALAGGKALPTLKVEKGGASGRFPVVKVDSARATPREGFVPRSASLVLSGFAGSRVLPGFAGWQNPVKIFVLKGAHINAFPRVVVVDWMPRNGLGKGNRQNGVCAQVGFVGFVWFCCFFGFAGSPVRRSIVRSVKLKPYAENFAISLSAQSRETPFSKKVPLKSFHCKTLQPLVNRSPLARVIVLESLLDPGFCWVSTGCKTLSNS